MFSIIEGGRLKFLTHKREKELFTFNHDKYSAYVSLNACEIFKKLEGLRNKKLRFIEADIKK